jgi:phosphatidylinositol-3-phosphatase
VSTLVKSSAAAAAAALVIAACGPSGTTSSSGSNSAGPGGAGGSSTGTDTTATATTGNGGAATTSTGTTSTSTTATSSTGTSSSTGMGGGGGFGTIFTILFENHDYKEVVGSTDAPYFNSLIAQYGLATNYLDSGTHPSLPNYLYLISGDTQYPGIIDVNPDWVPYFPSSGDHLGHQMDVANIKWRSYQESAGGPCVLDVNGNYAPKHNPFLYFKDIQGDSALCADRNVDLTAFDADLASGAYKYMWITPDLIDDGHDPQADPVTGLKQSDAWLSTFLPKILASSAYQNNGVIFITWDEAEGHNGDSGDQVPMIVVSPKLKSAGMKVNTPLSHASYLATVEEILGIQTKLGAAATATDMMEFFGP